MKLQVFSLCGAADWFLRSVKPPDADPNGRHQHGHGQHGGSERQLKVGRLQADVVTLDRDKTSLFVYLELNCEPNLRRCGRYAHAKRSSRGKLELGFFSSNVATSTHRRDPTKILSSTMLVLLSQYQHCSLHDRQTHPPTQQTLSLQSSFQSSLS